MRCDSHKLHREFTVGDTINVEVFTPSSQKKIEGIIADVTGLLSCKVKLNDGTEVQSCGQC